MTYAILQAIFLDNLSRARRTRERGLNISRITEQALLSILDYLETQNTTKNSKFLNERSFQKKVLGAGSLARLGHLLDVQKVAGSSPARPTMLC